ncbi:type I-B CRISPR-associated protein Cas8b1/Cst1 [Methanobacterium alcaliphilum]|uniref:type I-B CRISPR-associated protein Cas8b1/Cst1 n=1 Tax=Methanobacterium alcaliphilum TaxID=392018 RepID=UPI00200AF755|nr:type I-B CRISPR-associated protein Cas8b1/Cst1 [Methanobacterium alcaliphilum]MCK9150527.1 type I-B CRISPR-associated protein Cas8b1/Cst1 [Methanobacterium alcaliphilum]
MSEVIFDFTGNPFVDAGIWAISEWVGKRPEELDKMDMMGIIDEIVELYLTPKWSKNLYQIFPNNPITNNAVKDKKERYSSILRELVEKTEFIGDNGNCIACGRRNILYRSSKDKIPLTGSKKLINYFSFGAEGADYCPACAFAIQFVPLMSYACGNMLLLHSGSKKVMGRWSKNIKKNIDVQISLKEYTGCPNEGFKNPKNAIFHIIQDIIMTYDERWVNENPSITFYHFTNFNQGPSLDIYFIPTPVFRFLTYIPQHEKKEDWFRIVRKGYQYVNWEKVKEESEYKNRENKVYNNLLEGKSIIKYFIDKKTKEAIGGWELISHYLEEVRNMDKKRIDSIKKLGDEIAHYIESMDDMKMLNRLEMASDYRSFRNILRIIIKKRISNGIENPLFTFDDYVTYLFPEGNLTWRETQDLILFRIYEKLQPWIIQKGNQEEIEIQEPEEVEEEE